MALVKDAVKETSTYKTSNKSRLVLLVAGTLVIDIGIVFGFYIGVFHLNFYIPLLALLLPFALLALEIKAWNKDVRVERFTHCRYSPICSFYFRHEPEYKMSNHIDMNRINDEIASGDILLRRYTYYLDELVFSQHSFFTHVGIYICDKDGSNGQVWHATGKEGVHPSSLKSFCSCDNLALLRFSTNKSKAAIERIIEDKEVTDEEMREIQCIILNNEHDKDYGPELKKNELSIFDSIKDTIATKNLSANSLRQILETYDYESIIKNRVLSLNGTKYDWKFNFKKFDTFCCIEYVWYSLKCLFPLHRIEIKDFEYFKLVAMPVIIPDVFLKNDFFENIYNSLQVVQNSEDFKKLTRPRIWRLWWFPFNIVCWYAIILLGSNYVPGFVVYFVLIFMTIKIGDFIVSRRIRPGTIFFI